MTWLFPKVLAATIAFVIAIWAFARSRQRGRARRRRGSSGQLGVALQNIEGLFVESKKHVVEAQREEHLEEKESGEPPVK
jgi:hypothetical protein